MSLIPKNIIENTLRRTGKYWIVFTGDSITSCEWVHPNWRDIVIYVLHYEFTDILQGDWKTVEWGIRGFNFAYDGATTKDILEKIDDILLVKPQLVLSLMGGNDAPLGVGVTQSTNNIIKISRKVLQAQSSLIWCSSTPAGKGSKKNSEYEPYALAINQLPSTDNFFAVDMFHLYQDFPTEKFFTFTSEENPVEGIKEGELDLQHPNQLGNAYIAKVILEAVFGISFNPDSYMADTIRGEKFPDY